MKLKEAMSIINEKEKGFMVSFEKRNGGILSNDHFPDKHAGEGLITTEKYAWELAERFAKATDDTYVNIYVIDNNFSPVIGYEGRLLKKY